MEKTKSKKVQSVSSLSIWCSIDTSLEGLQSQGTSMTAFEYRDDTKISALPGILDHQGFDERIKKRVFPNPVLYLMCSNSNWLFDRIN